MHDSKAVQLLAAFSKEEINRLGKFLDSPYFGCKPVVNNLFTAVKKYYPRFDKEKLVKQKVFSELYPGKGYNDVLIRKLVSELGKHIEEFIAVERILSNRLNKSVSYLEAVIEKKANVPFGKTLDEVKEGLEAAEKIYNDFLKDSATVNRLSFNYYNTVNNFKDSSESLQLYGDYLVSYFLQTLTDIYKTKAQMLSSYNPESGTGVFDSFYKNFDFQNFINESASSAILKDYNFLQENYLIYRIHSDIDDFQSYNRLKELVTANITKYDYNYATRVINSLLNFGLSRIIHRKDASYYKELFRLYKVALESGNLLSFHNKFMNLVTYRNILFISTAAGEFDWVEKFIEEYLPVVNDDNRETLKHFSRAVLNFERKDFKSSLDELSKIKFDHVVFKLDTKNLLLKNYYELAYIEPAYSLIDAYRHMLAGNINLSAGVKKMHSDFITYYQRLLNLLSKKEEYNIQKLKKEVEADEGVISREWLIEKVGEL